MNRIFQTNRWNCGSACLAMVLGQTIEDVEEDVLHRRVGDLKDPQTGNVIGVTPMEFELVLWQRGIRYGRVQPTIYNPQEGQDWYARTIDDMPLTYHANEMIEVHLRDGATAILGVDSKTVEGGEHWIVAEGMVLLDPSPSDTIYTRVQDDAPVAVHEAFLLDMKKSNGGSDESE